MRALALIIVPLLAACSAPAPGPAEPPAASPRVVGYFTDWGVYGRDYQVKDVDTSGAADRLTHLVYAFGRVSGGRCAMGDAWADHLRPVPAEDDVDGVAGTRTTALRGNFGQLRELKARHRDLRVLWSFGGWTGSAGFRAAAAHPAAFAASCRALLRDPRWAGVFDGIDIDWEYPNACGLTCDTSGPGALPALLTALRAELGPDAVITAAVPGDAGRLERTDYARAAVSADWLSAMTYDYAGTGGTGPTAPHSPLTAYPGIRDAGATTEATLAELARLGVPPAKTLLGVGFYGRGWTGVTRDAPGGRGTGPAPGRSERGVEDYRVLSVRCPPTGTVGGQAYARCGDQWWAYDTPATLTAKMTYARGRALGGAFAWELSGDTPDAALLNAVADGLTAGAPARTGTPAREATGHP